MRNHPWYTTLVLFVIGAVSFVVAGITPYLDNNRSNQHWSTSQDHVSFVLSLILWLIIPALCLLGMIVTGIVGVVWRMHHDSVDE